MPTLESLWHGAVQSPVFGVAATLAAYQIGLLTQKLCRGVTLVNPLLIAVVLLVGLLEATKTSYADYMKGGAVLSFLLGPATVALALPLYNNMTSIRKNALSIIPAVLAGSVTTCVLAMAIGAWLGASPAVVLTLGTHSATTPVAMGIADQIGGQDSLAAAFTLLTGLCGVMSFSAVMALARVKDWRARGLGIGVAAHGLGTARMFQLNETAAAYAGMAIGLGALITAILTPFLAPYFVR